MKNHHGPTTANIKFIVFQLNRHQPSRTKPKFINFNNEPPRIINLKSTSSQQHLAIHRTTASTTLKHPSSQVPTIIALDDGKSVLFSLAHPRRHA
jgi:hypothetical protein